MEERHPYTSADAASRFVNHRSTSTSAGDDTTPSSNARSAGASRSDSSDSCAMLQLPQRQKHDVEATDLWSASILRSNLKKSYTNAHSYHINGISLSADNDRFISSDDLRINLWQIEDPTKCFTVVDRKPSNIEDLNEIITCSTTHPTNTNCLAFSTSKGQINLADLRRNAVCKDSDFLSFQTTDDWCYNSGISRSGSGSGGGSGSPTSDTNPGLYSELMKSILDVKFTADGRYIASRDYLSIKVWDTHMTKEPVKVIELHSHLKPLLPQLYESESIFDKFTMNFSPCGQKVVTGGYNNMFLVHDVHGSGKQCVEGELPNFLDADGPKSSGSLS